MEDVEFLGGEDVRMSEYSSGFIILMIKYIAPLWLSRGHKIVWSSNFILQRHEYSFLIFRPYDFPLQPGIKGGNVLKNNF